MLQQSSALEEQFNSTISISLSIASKMPLLSGLILNVHVFVYPIF